MVLRVADDRHAAPDRAHHVALGNRLGGVVRALAVHVRPDAEQQRLDRAVASLPEKQKAVFVLRFYDGLPYEEIASMLRTSVGGLKANYHHALRKVQEMMRDEVSKA